MSTSDKGVNPVNLCIGAIIAVVLLAAVVAYFDVDNPRTVTDNSETRSDMK